MPVEYEGQAITQEEAKKTSTAFGELYEALENVSARFKEAPVEYIFLAKAGDSETEDGVVMLAKVSASVPDALMMLEQVMKSIFETCSIIEQITFMKSLNGMVKNFIKDFRMVD